MTTLLSASPELLSSLAKPSVSYTRRAWAAMAGLLLFLGAYLFLAIWFLRTAYRLSLASSGGVGVIVGICAGLLAIFMLKGFLFVKRGVADQVLEITQAQQPRLFEFLHQLADRAGAPRPHKVFLSARVNAAVFYDLSILNFIFPSKKNLEIGLGLVNVLNRGELEAVLAHEFGHFAQKAMAVGRWVYIAQQVAENLVARRDKFDAFLDGWSRIDFRLAWMAWILSIVIWSIRSVVDTAFRAVILIQRALSREMEMNADLVAVSLTGSDALIHALHRLQAADDSWGRAISFAFEEKSREKVVDDVFVLQTAFLKKMATLLNDETYSEVPNLPLVGVEKHRIFRAELAQPPQMWLTHPMNHEREANAKRQYVKASIDESSAWGIFDDELGLRRQVTELILDAGKLEKVSAEICLTSLEKQFDREYLKSQYRGVYFHRSCVRDVAHYADLYEKIEHVNPYDLDSLYPDSLSQEILLLTQLEKEIGQLRAIKNGHLQAQGKQLNFRGRELKRNELSQVIEEVEQELKGLEQRLHLHDKRCRSLHLSAAKKMGNAWPEYLRGLLNLIHYAEHTAANLRDAKALLQNRIAVATATRKVSESGISEIIQSANDLQHLLAVMYLDADQVVLDNIVRQRLEVSDWKSMLGEFKLGVASRDNINEWVKVIDGWVDAAVSACGALRVQALEQLLISESVIAKHVRAGTEIIPAPAPSVSPRSYATLLNGQERKRQTHLNWWARFQNADGPFALFARLLVAGGVVVGVLGFGMQVGSTTITIYNGLARAVDVKIGQQSLHVEPLSHREMSILEDKPVLLTTRTSDGQLVEQFDVDVQLAFGHFVYNVASASPMVEWTNVYGNGSPRPERQLGIPRWFDTHADHIFTDPPKTVSSKTGGAVRDVLTGFANYSPAQQMAVIKDDNARKTLILAHARWDETGRSSTLEWMAAARTDEKMLAILALRSKETPSDIVVGRNMQDVLKGKEKLAYCEGLQKLAAAQSEDGNLHYLAIRCGNYDTAQRQAMLDAHAKWPANAWLNYAAGYAYAENMRYPEAMASFERARTELPQMSVVIALEKLRLARLMQIADTATLTQILKGDERLQGILSMESHETLEEPYLRAFQALNQGKLKEALEIVKDDAATTARILRYAAVSVGASEDLRTRALALPKEAGIDSDSVWSAVALALQTHQDYDAYLNSQSDLPPAYIDTCRTFIDKLSRRDVVAAEASLLGLPPEYRAKFLSIGIVVLGTKSPSAWREQVKRGLFANERPYLG